MYNYIKTRNDFVALSDDNAFVMTRYCEFIIDNRTKFIATSGDEFIKIFINFENDNWLFPRLRSGYFESWLRHVGEIELSNLILDINNNNASAQDKKRAIKNKFRNIKYFQAINLEKIIELKLKEYETIRAEILFHMQNRIQIILVGLTGLFAIAAVALTPLTDFFTAKEIIIPLNSQITINAIIDNGNIEEKITTPINSTKTITRAIKGDTINNKAIIPSVIILAAIIPVASISIILRLADFTKSIYRINKYIVNGIETELSQLFKRKLETEIYYNQEINRNESFLAIENNNALTNENRNFWQGYINTKNTDFQLTETNFLYWERYIFQNRQNRQNNRDLRIIKIVKSLFWLIAFLSWLGSLRLISWDFDCSNSSCPIFNFSTTDIIIWLIWGVWTGLLIVALCCLRNDLQNDL
ncbi:MAG: hypothetical protein AB4372_30480 [Xenococcus sp. (in: cyanobacteria)]